MSFREQLKAAVIVEGLKAKREGEFQIYVQVLLGFHAIARNNPDNFVAIEAEHRLNNLFALINQDFSQLSEAKKAEFIDQYCSDLKNKGPQFQALQQKFVKDLSQNVVDESIQGGKKHADETQSEYTLLLEISQMFDHHRNLWAQGKKDEADRYFDNQIMAKIHLFSAEKTNKVFYAMAHEFSQFTRAIPAKGTILSPAVARFVSMGSESIDASVGVASVLNAVVDFAMKDSVILENEIERQETSSRIESAKRAIAGVLAKVTPKDAIKNSMTPGLERLEHAVSRLPRPRVLSVHSVSPVPEAVRRETIFPVHNPENFVAPSRIGEKSPKKAAAAIAVPELDHDKEPVHDLDDLGSFVAPNTFTDEMPISAKAQIHSFSDFYESIQGAEFTEIVGAVKGLYDRLTETPEGTFLLMGRDPAQMIIQISTDRVYDTAYSMLDDVQGAISAIQKDQPLTGKWESIPSEIESVKMQYKSLNRDFQQLQNDLVQNRARFLELNQERTVLKAERDALNVQFDAVKAKQVEFNKGLKDKIALSEIKALADLRGQLHQDIAASLPPAERFLFQQKLEQLGKAKENIIKKKQDFWDRTFGLNIAEAVANHPEIRPQLKQLTDQFWLEVERDIFNTLPPDKRQKVDARMDTFNKDVIEKYLQMDREMLNQNNNISEKLREVGQALAKKDSELREKTAEQRQIAYDFMRNVDGFQLKKKACFQAADRVLNKIATLKIKESPYLEGLQDYVKAARDKIAKASESIESLRTKVELGTHVVMNAMSRQQIATEFHGDLAGRQVRHDREALDLPKTDEELSNWEKFQFNAVDMSAVTVLQASYEGEVTDLSRYTSGVEAEVGAKIAHDKRVAARQAEIARRAQERQAEATRPKAVQSKAEAVQIRPRSNAMTMMQEAHRDNPQNNLAEKISMVNIFLDSYKAHAWSNKARTGQIELLREALRSPDEKSLNDTIKSIHSQIFNDNGTRKDSESRWMGESRMEKFLKTYDQKFNLGLKFELGVDSKISSKPKQDSR